MKSLITGIAGFAGSHLAELLLSRDDDVAGILGPNDSTERIENLAPRLSLFSADIRDGKALGKAFESFPPDRVFHLAGIAHVGGSWSQKETTLSVNILGAFQVLEAAFNTGSSVLLVGSGEEYGFVADDEQPIQEDRPLNPSTPYGASKVAQEVLGRQYHTGHEMAVQLVRSFNHFGPRQEPIFVVPEFARQVAEIEKGLRPPQIHVGNLDAQRDFTDVRDMMLGYTLLTEKGRPGVPYNLCSGKATRIKDLLTILLSKARTEIEVVIDKDRYRPIDIPMIVGDPSRAAADLGWSARIPVKETLEWTLEYWREQVSKTRNNV